MSPSGPALLKPIVQTGAVDVSDIDHLSGASLRKVLVERARALAPLLESNALATETGRRVVEANIEAIRAAGLFKIMVPRRHGGLETDFRTQLEVTRELGKACGSTAWVTTLMNTCAFFGGLASAQAQEDIWGQNPDARVAGVFAPLAATKRVEGGLMATGKWPWASGCLHADWAVVGLPVVDAAGETIDQGMAFIPMSECTIEDTWHVAGMKGTGSNTIVAKDVFIPDHRIMSIGALLQGQTATFTVVTNNNGTPPVYAWRIFNNSVPVGPAFSVNATSGAVFPVSLLDYEAMLCTCAACGPSTVFGSRCVCVCVCVCASPERSSTTSWSSI